MSAPFSLFLDFDGVVFRGFHANPNYCRSWAAHIEQDLGIVEENMVAHVFKHPDFLCVAEGKIDLKLFLAQALPNAGYHDAVDDFITYWFTKDGGAEHINLALLDCVRKLRNDHDVPVYLVTTQEHYRKKHIIEKMQIGDEFDKMFFSCDLGVTKNESGFFTKIADILGLNIPQHKAVLFDDSSDYCHAARAAGWEAVTYNTIEDFVAHSLINPLISTSKPPIILA